MPDRHGDEIVRLATAGRKHISGGKHSKTRGFAARSWASTLAASPSFLLGIRCQNCGFTENMPSVARQFWRSCRTGVRADDGRY
jgi:hypothetical protein